MSRIWRDGQKHSVYVYRLLTTGTIEEKIYQRQVSKQCLSGTVLNPSSAEKFKFSQNELKDLFTLYENTECLTHDLIKCQCLISDQSTLLTERNIEDNLTSLQLAQNASMAELMNWKHIKGPLSNENIIDFCLADDHKDITFLFLNKVNS
ncbi:DNA repair and recombination protein RAD54B-like isoform X1 [Stegodyphus dumicola]|uniref:DNA repair and recombination protein RAD54B-like isoform X1 n=1 Tax=Stegodyphus dumicola TaxID=202533 RepID=UPI0015ACE58A|nr:DNA repair and recombination protein RAD54B-like isoform X1 [Stegodyphus dumicola]